MDTSNSWQTSWSAPIPSNQWQRKGVLQELPARAPGGRSANMEIPSSDSGSIPLTKVEQVHCSTSSWLNASRGSQATSSAKPIENELSTLVLLLQCVAAVNTKPTKMNRSNSPFWAAETTIQDNWGTVGLSFYIDSTRYKFAISRLSNITTHFFTVWTYK